MLMLATVVAAAAVPAVPGCCDFSGTWHNQPDMNHSIKYNFMQANGSCVVKGLHDCDRKFNGTNASHATGDVLHGCPSFYSKGKHGFPGGMTGTLNQKAAAPLDELRWENGVHWYREHGAPCPAPEPQAVAAADPLTVSVPGPAAATSAFGGRAGPTFDVAHFGAVPDNATLNTKAFEAGVAAVAKAGGGTLVVPAGAFRTGPFNLTSHMTLYMSSEAAIYGPTYTQLGAGPAFDMWPIIPPMPSYGQGRDHVGPRRAAFIGGVGLTDVTVTAAENAWGTIDGAGAPWWACHCDTKEARARASLGPDAAYDAEARTESGGCSSSWAQQYPCKGPGKEEVTRGHLIEFAHSSDIEISNLNLRNSPFWTVHPFRLWAPEFGGRKWVLRVRDWPSQNGVFGFD